MPTFDIRLTLEAANRADAVSVIEEMIAAKLDAAPDHSVLSVSDPDTW